MNCDNSSLSQYTRAVNQRMRDRYKCGYNQTEDRLRQFFEMGMGSDCCADFLMADFGTLGVDHDACRDYKFRVYP